MPVYSIQDETVDHNGHPVDIETEIEADDRIEALRTYARANPQSAGHTVCVRRNDRPGEWGTFFQLPPAITPRQPTIWNS